MTGTAEETTTFAVTSLGLALSLIAIFGVLAGLVTRRSDLVVLAAPAAAVLVHGLARAPGRGVGFEVSLTVDSARVLVGEPLGVRVGVTSLERIGRVEAAVRVLPPLGAVTGMPTFRTLRLEPNNMCTYEFALRGHAIGRAAVGPVALRWHDPVGLVRYERVLGEVELVRVIPSVPAIRSLVAAAQTGAHFGEQTARSRADGFEFADSRAWRHGDPAARINWRVSARRDEPWVIDRHPDRNEDVVVFVDSFADARGSDGRSSLLSSLEIAAAIGSAHLARRDRVGYIGYGGLLQWIVPSAGQLAHYRLVDTMVETIVFASTATKDVGVVPVRALPRRALVIAVTPLLDERGTTAIRVLAARGHDVAVIAVDPLSIVDPLPLDAADVEVLGRHLWGLEQERQRRLIAASGVAVIRWTRPPDGALTGLESVLREATTGRRRMRTARSARAVGAGSSAGSVAGR